MMDGLRPKNLSFCGYGRKTSPNIDSLAKQGIFFENTFSSYNSTYKSVLSIITGRHVLSQEFSPYHTKEEMKLFFNSGGILLQKILKKKGYKTYCFKKLYGWQNDGFDYTFKQTAQEKSKKGTSILGLKKFPPLYKSLEYLFQNFVPKEVANLARMTRRKSDSKTITNNAIKIINEMREGDNFFMWLDYMDTHAPYRSPIKFKKFKAEKESEKILDILAKKDYDEKLMNSFRNWFSGFTVEDIIAEYDNTIAYNDYLIGKVIDSLKQKGIFENTIIFFFSDHGESHTEHESYFEHYGIYGVTFHVPLIIVGKGVPRGIKVKGLTQLTDIAPTLLSLLKINHTPLLFDGKNLLPLMFGKKDKIRESVFMEEYTLGMKRRAIRNDKYMYAECPEEKYSICSHCNTSHGDIISLYDLEKDPEENVNIANKNKKILIEMKSKLDEKIKELKTINEKRKIQIALSKL